MLLYVIWRVHIVLENILITPDKIMSMELFNKIIKEIKSLEIPSIKLNWRGEPLLNPNLIQMIKLEQKIH